MGNQEDDCRSISVIMPVYNGMEFLQHSLPPLAAMVQRGEIAELIVVDDGSTDDSRSYAQQLGARVIYSGGRLGPAGARNTAAEIATGELLWFVDADVVVHEDAARVLAGPFTQENVVAVFGSYDDQPSAPNFLSQYKNLVHHFYHQTGVRQASTFWSGCGAVRKSSFLAVGGFDLISFTRPSIEDIELGSRLLRQGGRILLMKELLSTHLKVWRFVNLIHTEVFCRAIPWSRLILSQEGFTDALNVSMAERIRSVIAGLFTLSVLGALFSLLPSWTPLPLLVIAIIANLELWRLFNRRHNPLFALRGLLFHQLYYLYSGAAFVWCWLERRIFRLMLNRRTS